MVKKLGFLKIGTKKEKGKESTSSTTFKYFKSGSKAMFYLVHTKSKTK